MIDDQGVIDFDRCLQEIIGGYQRMVILTGGGFDCPEETAGFLRVKEAIVEGNNPISFQSLLSKIVETSYSLFFFPSYQNFSQKKES